MSSPRPRLRPHPDERFAGPEHVFTLAESFEALRREPHEARDGHRQITIFSSGSLRMVLFAFEPGGCLPAHTAPGYVAIHAVRGRMRVRTSNSTYDLSSGELLMLDPDVEHDLEAQEEADVLLTVSLVG